MKRDWKAIKAVLEEIDALEDPQMQGIVIEAKGSDSPELLMRLRHAILLHADRFLSGTRHDTLGAPVLNAPDLTGAGHDLLEALRRPGVWEHLQGVVAEGGNPTFGDVLGYAQANVQVPAPRREEYATEPREATPQDIFDWRALLHPMVRDHALQLFERGHLREAVLNAIMVPYEIMRSRTGIDLDGAALAGQVLSVKAPRLILSEIATDSGRNDQLGFMQMLQGAATAIRNVKAHSLGHDLHPVKAAEYLVFASLLARRVSEARDAPPDAA